MYGTVMIMPPWRSILPVGIILLLIVILGTAGVLGFYESLAITVIVLVLVGAKILTRL